MPEYVPVSTDEFRFFALSGARRAALRLIYFLSSILTLYFVIAPIISRVPRSGPAWGTAVFWCGAIFFVAATLLAKSPLGYGLAVAGGLCISSLYLCQVLVRLGYFRVQYRLVAPAHEIPRWRFTLDKPLFLLLLISTLASLVLSVPLLIGYARMKLQAGIRN